MFCWSGHIARISDNSASKILLYEELPKRKRPAHKPKKIYKNALKESLKITNIRAYNWDLNANYRSIHDYW